MIPNLSLNRLDAPPALIHLPPNFPDDTETPRLLYGDRVRWKPLFEETSDADTGVIIGRFYAFAHHQKQWAWKYLIFLEPGSYSYCFCTADTAWEEDLESLA